MGIVPVGPAMSDSWLIGDLLAAAATPPPAAGDPPETLVVSSPEDHGDMNRSDPLTVLDHELENISGFEHTDWGLMSPALAGIRETPTLVLDQFFTGM
jgi:hypothetical protein